MEVTLGTPVAHFARHQTLAATRRVESAQPSSPRSMSAARPSAFPARFLPTTKSSSARSGSHSRVRAQAQTEAVTVTETAVDVSKLNITPEDRNYVTPLLPFFSRETRFNKVAENAWALTQPLGLPFPDVRLRMAVLRLSDNSLALVNSVALTGECRKYLDSLGMPVKYLLLGNSALEHYFFAKDYVEAYPDIIVGAPEALMTNTPAEVKRVDYKLDDPSAPWASELQLAKLYLQGLADFTEFLIYHNLSKSVVATDTVFYLNEVIGENPFHKFVWSLSGLNKEPKMFPPLEQLAKQGGPNLVRMQEAARTILSWDLSDSTLILGHGAECPPGTAGQTLKKTFGQFLDPPLWQALTRNDKDGIKKEIDAGADVNARNSSGETPLLFIAKKGHYTFPPAGVPTLLLDAGADMEAKNEEDLTPLQVSLLSGWQKIAILLLDRGADKSGVEAIKSRVTCPDCKRVIAENNL